MKTLKIITLIFSLSSLSLTASASYTNLYAFGDSLSDSGNAYSPYDSGRYTNGPVWVETLATRLGLSADPYINVAGGTNYAFAGARTGPVYGIPPNVIDQVNIFTASNTVDPDALYSVWGGGNDIRAAGEQVASFNFDGAVNTMGNAIQSTIQSILTLHGHGANNFLIPNLPDLGLTPGANLIGSLGVYVASLFTTSFNDVLSSALTDIETIFPAINITKLDIFSLTNDMLTNPSTFGFSNVTDACYSNGSSCADPDAYLFWDLIHPSTAGHNLIADLAYEALAPAPVLTTAAVTAVPLPAAFWLFLSAITGLVAQRKYK